MMKKIKIYVSEALSTSTFWVEDRTAAVLDAVVSVDYTC